MVSDGDTRSTIDSHSSSIIVMTWSASLVAEFCYHVVGGIFRANFDIYGRSRYIYRDISTGLGRKFLGSLSVRVSVQVRWRLLCRPGYIRLIETMEPHTSLRTHSSCRAFSSSTINATVMLL